MHFSDYSTFCVLCVNKQKLLKNAVFNIILSLQWARLKFFVGCILPSSYADITQVCIMFRIQAGQLEFDSLQMQEFFPSPLHPVGSIWPSIHWALGALLTKNKETSSANAGVKNA